MAKVTIETFKNLFKYYAEESHQIKAIELLYSQIDSKLLEDDCRWIQSYRNIQPEPPAPNPVEGEVLLKVPYQMQGDNSSGTGYRECFSSSCAMVAMYYGKVENDDAYNQIRAKYGDTTDSSAQLKALRELGLDAEFVQTGTTDDLRRILEEGRPVPVGWLHQGPVSSPSGGGHWSVIVGYQVGKWIVHDPNGEADLVPGGYTDNKDGSYQQYSYKNWNPRWIVAGEGDGWYLDVRKAAVSKPTVTSQAGVDLIKSFEGLRLKAYPDPATGGDPWTIGYGHTGNDVVPGLVITDEEADEMLKNDLKRFEAAVSRLIKVPFNQNEFDATVSFAFNVGAGALENSTFRRRINSGENKSLCFKEEFPRWVNGGGREMPGLVRRRDAEIKLATA